jgi:hypothetical protein
MHVPLGVSGRELWALRRQVGDHKLTGSRIDMRLLEALGAVRPLEAHISGTMIAQQSAED